MWLTETQKKVDDTKIVKNVKIIQSMQDRKGGGLLIMYKEKNMTFKRWQQEAQKYYM